MSLHHASKSLLDTNDGVPLYRKLAGYLRNQILEGAFSLKESLPAEMKLMEQFNISRATVRQAMSLLENDGLIHRVQGKGTFVTQKLNEQDFMDFHNFTQEIKSRGQNPTFKIIDFRKVKSKMWDDVFEISEFDEVWVIERIKKANDVPVMFERLFIPCRIMPDITLEELERDWLSVILPQKYSIQFSKVKKFIEPIIIGDYEAKYLEVNSRSLGLLVDRLTWSNDVVAMITRSIASNQTRYSIEIGH